MACSSQLHGMFFLKNKFNPSLQEICFSSTITHCFPQLQLVDSLDSELQATLPTLLVKLQTCTLAFNSSDFGCKVCTLSILERHYAHAHLHAAAPQVRYRSQIFLYFYLAIRQECNDYFKYFPQAKVILAESHPKHGPRANGIRCRTITAQLQSGFVNAAVQLLPCDCFYCCFTAPISMNNSGEDDRAPTALCKSLRQWNGSALSIEDFCTAKSAWHNL